MTYRYIHYYGHLIASALSAWHLMWLTEHIEMILNLQENRKCTWIEAMNTTLHTESIFDVRMLHMVTDSAMSASGVQIEGTTFLRVKILDYHDMLPFLLPIHLYKHQKYDIFVKLFMYIPKLYKHIVWDVYGFVWIPYGCWHFEPNHARWLLRHINRFMQVAHFQCQTMFIITFTGLNSHMYLLWISEL